MKTIMVTFGGTATEGDMVALTATGPRGGASSVKYYTRDGDTPDKIAQELAMKLCTDGGEMPPGGFRGVAKGPVLMITCADSMTDYWFYPSVSGAATETVTIETF